MSTKRTRNNRRQVSSCVCSVVEYLFSTLWVCDKRINDALMNTRRFYVCLRSFWNKRASRLPLLCGMSSKSLWTQTVSWVPSPTNLHLKFESRVIPSVAELISHHAHYHQHCFLLKFPISLFVMYAFQTVLSCVYGVKDVSFPPLFSMLRKKICILYVFLSLLV